MATPLSLPDKLRALFCAEMQRRGNKGYGSKPLTEFDGGRTKDGRNVKSTWLKLAKIITDNNVDPAIYIGLVFWNTTRFPRPFEITSPVILERYNRYLLNMPTRLSTIYRSGITLMGSLLRELDALALDENVRVAMALARFEAKSPSVLLYYCFAVAAGRLDIADAKRTAAIEELAIHPEAFKQAWPGGLIPEDVYNEAIGSRQNFNTQLRQYT